MLPIKTIGYDWCLNKTCFCNLYILWNVCISGKKGATARVLRSSRNGRHILLIIGIVYGVCRIVIKSVQQCTHFLLCRPNEAWETYCACSVSYYYYYSYYYYSSSYFFLSFFRQKFIRHISRRLLNGNQWNFTGMLSTMSRCADYFRNFQNGRSCHGNGQNAKILKNTKKIIAGYSPNRNWWNLIGTTSTSSGTR